MNFWCHDVPSRARAAFSLVEVIAVIAVMAILAAVMAPVLIRQVDFAAQTKEAKDMDLIVKGLQEGVSRARFVPLNDTNNWAVFVATNAGLEVSAVKNNTFSGNPRVFLVDPRLRIGAAAATDPGYQQPGNGASSNTSPRLMIVSSMSVALPFGSGVALSAADFDALWTNLDGSAPSGALWGAWRSAGGDPHDLTIRRVNLADAFVRVILNNLDSQARYVVDGFTNTVPLVIQTNLFLGGTVLDLLTRTLAVQASQVLQRDVSWVFQNGVWRIQAAGPSTYGGTYGPLQPTVQAFLNNSPNNFVAPATVAQDMMNYMSAYRNWAADSSFPAPGPLKSAAVAAADQLNLHIGRMTGTLP